MSAVTSTTTEFAPAGTWSADPVHSHVGFEVEYAGVNTFRGSFSDFSVALTGGSEPTLEGTAKVAGVDVKDENLNGHLQTPDFFDAARYPEIAFKATELHRLEDNSVEGSGELMRRESATPPAVLRRNVTSPGGTTEAALRVLAADGALDQLMVRAVRAAAARSRELAS